MKQLALFVDASKIPPHQRGVQSDPALSRRAGIADSVGAAHDVEVLRARAARAARARRQHARSGAQRWRAEHGD